MTGIKLSELLNVKMTLTKRLVPGNFYRKSTTDGL